MKNNKLNKIKDKLDSYGFTLITQEYKGAKYNYDICCNECKLEFKNHYSRIMNSNKPIRCPYCDRDKPNSVKWYLKLIQDYCALVGVEFLSEKYRRSTDVYKFKCSCGNIFNRRWTTFYVDNAIKCNECVGFTRWDIDKVRLEVEKHGLSLMSTEYKSYHHDKLKIKCSCGNIYEQTFAQFLHSKYQCCDECIGYVQWDIDRVREKSKELGMELLSTKYVNTTTLMKFKCECGSIFHRKWANVLYAGATTCYECQGRTNWDVDKCTEYAKSHTTAEFLSTEYDNMFSIYEFKCECGEHFKRSWKNFVDANQHVCLVCANAKSHGERRISKYLDDNNIEYFEEYTIDDMRSSNAGGMLRFDFYLPEYNIAIEFDGEQHYRPVQFGGMSLERAEEEFIKTQERDKSKNQYCKDNNILLHRIPYHQLNNIESILKTIVNL